MDFEVIEFFFSIMIHVSRNESNIIFAISYRWIHDEGNFVMPVVRGHCGVAGCLRVLVLVVELHKRPVV